jgi:hypothetical protein
MADVATPPAAQTATTETKQQIVKPEKPDEDKYKEDLAKAEKEHTAAQDKLVSNIPKTLEDAYSCTIAKVGERPDTRPWVSSQSETKGIWYNTCAIL